MPGRFNLARRPFVDTRPANLTAVFLAVLVAALSFVAARTVIRYFAESSRTRASIVTLRAEISSLEDARQKAATSLARLDVPALAADVEDANEIALRRAFSWTRFLTRLEKTLPADLRIGSIGLQKMTGSSGSPALERRASSETVLVTLTLISRDPNGLPKTIRAFDASPWFGEPTPTAVRKAGERIRRLLPLARAGGIRRSPWRARLPLFAVLAVLLVAAMAILIGYHAFYDERFKALEKTRAELAAKRDEAAEATRRVVKTEERLRALQRDLENFNRDVLGGRKERLAAVIEDVYQLTEKAGTVPGQISYSFDEVGAATRLALSFNVQGRYADIKKLLFSFESNPRFLLLENVALTTDDTQPDVLRLNLTVAHYFRPA